MALPGTVSNGLGQHTSRSHTSNVVLAQLTERVGALVPDHTLEYLLSSQWIPVLVSLRQNMICDASLSSSVLHVHSFASSQK